MHVRSAIATRAPLAFLLVASLAGAGKSPAAETAAVTETATPPAATVQNQVNTAVARTSEEGEAWAGHEVLIGHVDLPLLGRVETRTDNYVIARVTRDGDKVRLEQIACGSSTKPVLGSSVTLPQTSFSRLPATSIEYRRSEGGWLVARPWNSGWGAEDVDGDGHPGVTYDVNAPMCGGQIYASVNNVAIARAREESGGRVAGEVKVRASQNVLGASGACLNVFAGDRREELRGTFAYAPVPPGATCASLGQAWPVAASEPVTTARR